MRPTPSLRDITAVVVSAGRMMNAAKVRTTKQTYNSRIQKVHSHSHSHPLLPSKTFPPKTPLPKNHPKAQTNNPPSQHFTVSRHHLVSDPTSALRSGDVIRMTTERHSRHIRHVVTAIVAPAGEPIAERPAVLTGEQREEMRAAKRGRKLARREERREGGGKGREGGDKAGEGEGVVVDAGKERDGRIVQTVRRPEREREKAEGRMGEAERMLGRLEARGLGVGEVETRLEGMTV
ncbi:hypothetical protein MMC27_005837 [Xylographa pallens]|nr:hypothetical protein [Xylographa pallens]